MRTTTTTRPAALLLAAALVAGLGACSADPGEPADPGRVVLTPAEGGGHTHTTLVGDGTTPDAGGYRLVLTGFPRAAREPGDLTFRIEDSRGRAVTDFVEEQERLLHLYVVRDDLGDFRHLHPVLGDDGTWSVRVDLADPGPYRVVAEFVPAAGPDGSHVVLAEDVQVPGTWAPAEVPDEPVGTDGLVTVEAPASVPTGEDQQMVLTVSDGADGVLNLGTYLGAYAHLTGFDVDTGRFVHAHPVGPPGTTEEGSELTFHTAFESPGRYRFFVQVRVDGFVHTVPVTTRVG